MEEMGTVSRSLPLGPSNVLFSSGHMSLSRIFISVCVYVVGTSCL